MDFHIRLRGVCTQSVQFEMDNGFNVHNVIFHGGCPGNTAGVAKLSEGMNADKIIAAVSGTSCGFKKTSCPDQFANALSFAKSSMLREKNAASTDSL